VKKIWLIARREFVSAVCNRGFLIGLLMMPALLALLAIVGPRLLVPGPSTITGEVMVVDPTGAVAGGLRSALDRTVSIERRGQQARRALSSMPPAARGVIGGDRLVAAAAGPEVHIRVVDPPSAGAEGPADTAADTGASRAWLRGDTPAARRLALIVVPADVLQPRTDARSDYAMYVAARLERQAETILHDAVREAIVSARTQAHDVDRERLEALLNVQRPVAVPLTGEGEARAANPLNVVLPLVLGGLMLVGVMVGGQTLLTSTIEEKSSRVIEVLLSAASPFQLMAGKILGQLAVSLLVLGVYSGLGIVLLISFAMVGLLDPLLVVYLLVFFLITYVFFGAVFATAGAAVNDMKEAQTLMGPVMLLLMGPWMVAFPITRDPDSALAVILSFLPPVNSFVMMLRLASASPPPAWQVLLSIGIGVMASAAAIWFAAKVFRIGLLMHGKPPNLATLWRWARAA
jgi:ABC-2 type transport system permease protein